MEDYKIKSELLQKIKEKDLSDWEYFDDFQKDRTHKFKTNLGNYKIELIESHSSEYDGTTGFKHYNLEVYNNSAERILMISDEQIDDGESIRDFYKLLKSKFHDAENEKREKKELIYKNKQKSELNKFKEFLFKK